MSGDASSVMQVLQSLATAPVCHDEEFEEEAIEELVANSETRSATS
jgi:hypothetical protein